MAWLWSKTGTGDWEDSEVWNEWSHHLPLGHQCRVEEKAAVDNSDWLQRVVNFDLVQSTDACITMPSAFRCAQSFEPTLAWATPIPETIIISIWKSQIWVSLLNSKESSSGIDSLNTQKNYPRIQYLKNAIKNMQLRNIYSSFCKYSVLNVAC